MKRPISSWQQTLLQLGLRIVWKSQKLSRTRGGRMKEYKTQRRPVWENLEPRQLLAGMSELTGCQPLLWADYATGTLGQSTQPEGEGNSSSIHGQAVAINAVDDEPWSGVVATFQDSLPGFDANDYVATIHWGESNYGYQGSSLGTVGALGNGQYEVRGTFTYAIEADRNVNVTINRIEGPTIVTTGSAKIHGAKPIYGSAGVALDRVELSTVALNTYPSYSGYYDEFGNYQYNYDPTDPSDFIVTVNWGDGTPVTSATWDSALLE